MPANSMDGVAQDGTSQLSTAQARPAPEHLLVAGLPRGILGAEGQRGLHVNQQFGIVAEGQDHAVRVRVGAQVNFGEAQVLCDCATPAP